MWPVSGHTQASYALIKARLDLRGKNRETETGRALGPKHSRRGWRRGEG